MSYTAALRTELKRTPARPESDALSRKAAPTGAGIPRFLQRASLPPQSAESPVGFQAKMTVGGVNDAHEQEADRVADQAMSAPPAATAAPMGMSRKCACGGTIGPDGECDACRAKRLALQRKMLSEPAGTDATTATATRSGSGQPLGAAARADMEARLGSDFSQVRIHTGPEATDSALSVGARAYTVGRDIVFAGNQYAPGTAQGNRLLAHELVHVLQQSGGRPASGAGAGAAGQPAAFSGFGAAAPGYGATGGVSAAPASVQRLAWGWILGGVGLVAAAGYGYWAYQCLEPLDEPMRTITLTRFLPEYYAAHGSKNVPARVWDAFGHCWIGCAGTKKCGAFTTAVAGKGREFYREYIDTAPHNSYEQDTNNQTLGRSFGEQEKSDCYDSCFAAADAAKGGLDLSAPEDNYWNPTDGFKAPPPAPTTTTTPTPTP